MGLGPVFATEHDDIANRLTWNGRGYSQGVGDHREIPFAGQFKGEQSRGRPSVEDQTFAVLDQLRSALRDARLFCDPRADPLGGQRPALRKVIRWDRPSVSSPNETAHRE